ncbi:unnamed protein product [Cuscuta epithymum]|nr:unnamed protein product [Cuscuta epithymum]
MTVVANPRQFQNPDWFLNKQNDYKGGNYSQVVSNALDMKLRDDLECLKKNQNHRGLRHVLRTRVCVYVDNTLRLLGAGERLLVSRRSVKHSFHLSHYVFLDAVF